MEIDKLSCSVPIQDYEQIVLGHGGGGKLSAELIEQVFLPAFGMPDDVLGDSTLLLLSGQRIAISTDSFVVRPLFFSGGSIGHLAVNGTVNDVAMSGARPAYLTASFILEEGLAIDELRQIVRDMAAASQEAGVKIVAGDTKVVERGHGDGCYINTTGIGILNNSRRIAIDQARPGDAVLISGTIGDHAMAIMSLREGLEFEAPISSDSAPLNGMIAGLLDQCPDVRALRDPTRGGLATTLNEIAQASKCGIQLCESSVPVDPVVRAACEFLGLDPMLAANEGKLVAIVPSEYADAALEYLKLHPHGREAAIIGRVVEDKHRLVIAKTTLGANRIVTMPIGEQLPRIC